jgi:uncharacterized membrane protein
MNFTEVIGNLHPALVHLPIGILLLTGLFQLLALKPKYAGLYTATRIALFWGMIVAILSGISGFLLSQTGDYDGLGLSQLLFRSLLIYLPGGKMNLQNGQSC